MDLSIKPANEIPVKTSEEMKDELIKNSEEIENKDADRISNIPLKTDMSDIFNTASKKSKEKIKKQREKLNKQQLALQVREERAKLKQQKEEMKAQREKVKQMATRTRKPRKKAEPKPKPKPVKKKRVKYVEVSDSESSSEEIVYVKKKKRSKPVVKPPVAPPKSRIQKLTPEELTQLYGVFKQADELNRKKKEPPKPKINYYNPIQSNPFSHLNNPFNF